MDPEKKIKILWSMIFYMMIEMSWKATKRLIEEKGWDPEYPWKRK